jgi:hypothetical protein
LAHLSHPLFICFVGMNGRGAIMAHSVRTRAPLNHPVPPQAVS